MESLGKYLKAARESQNLSLKDVSASTRIREHLLQAIEEDRYEILPSGYAKGFLNVYARHLGLNPNDIIRRYQTYMEKPTAGPVISAQENRIWRSLRANLRLLAISVVAILFVGFLVYYAFLKPTQRSSPSLSSFPPRQEEVETQATDLPEKVQTSRPTDTGAHDPAPKGSASFEVVDAGLGTGVERTNDFLTLTGKSSEFICNNHKVYFLTRIRAKNEGKISHVWLWQDKEFYRKDLEIKSPEWSVYSFITLMPNHSGVWKVEVRHEDKVIAALDFKAIESNRRFAPQKQ